LVGKSKIELLFGSLLNFSLEYWTHKTGQAGSLTDMSAFLKIMLRDDFKDGAKNRDLKIPFSVGRNATVSKAHLSCLLRRVQGFFVPGAPRGDLISDS
jgi:hypothetical protein